MSTSGRKPSLASFSLLERGLVGTFHHVGEQHLQRYVTELDFRWNTHQDGPHRCGTRAQLALKSISG
ncbi:hypothetical protein LYSHEL_21610 [Lysobacter helvus]|uniref:ISXO2-like transposase domain-containing protein n=3 Tax=Lysobacterales TaxID=135614 RepID=A0ABN6FTX9_9GAMM|nr:hypothetical protein LYSCAS_21620 [Lysobacter caseinilyticus]BCT96290.1 hypothetical protein LYSHEL_21610 [Lysobacter helvus]